MAQVFLLSKHRTSIIFSLENADYGTGTIVRALVLMATSQISLLISAGPLVSALKKLAFWWVLGKRH